jgi:ABC-type uncharacterized transport system substrate-binding protein
MRSVREHVASILIAAASLLVAPMTDAAAHPHILVTVETTVVYDKGAFTGLQEKWTFDEYYTAFAIEGLDKNHDGVYDREELSELAKVNIEAMKDVGYFTYPVLGGQGVKLKPAQDYWLEHKDSLLSLYFTLPFEQPILIEAEGFAYAVEDPTYYIAFLPAKLNPVKFADGAPKACKARIGDKGANGDAERLAKAFAQVATPISASQAVSIECTGR